MIDVFTKKDAEEFKEEIKDEFRRYMGILNEGFQHKLNLVIDGQAALEERLSNKIESAANGLRKEMKDMKQELKSEINGVRNEIISHRDNTEVHAQKARAKKSLGE